MKILTSIILLGLSCRYVKNKESRETKIKQENYKEKTKPSDQHVVSDPLDKDPAKAKGKPVGHEIKTLNEIDRYTLCSNRIV